MSPVTQRVVGVERHAYCNPSAPDAEYVHVCGGTDDHSRVRLLAKLLPGSAYFLNVATITPSFRHQCPARAHRQRGMSYSIPAVNARCSQLGRDIRYTRQFTPQKQGRTLHP